MYVQEDMSYEFKTNKQIAAGTLLEAISTLRFPELLQLCLLLLLGEKTVGERTG